MGVIQRYTQPYPSRGARPGPPVVRVDHHKQQHRLDEDETRSHAIGSRYMADQWETCKATHSPTPGWSAAAPSVAAAAAVNHGANARTA
jgi:hypothetical protein